MANLVAESGVLRSAFADTSRLHLYNPGHRTCTLLRRQRLTITRHYATITKHYFAITLGYLTIRFTSFRLNAERLKPGAGTFPRRGKNRQTQLAMQCGLVQRFLHSTFIRRGSFCFFAICLVIFGIILYLCKEKKDEAEHRQ